MFVSTRDFLCYTGTVDPPPEVTDPYSLVAAVDGWRRIEEIEDTQTTLRVTSALWAVALIGRYFSDAQLFFTLSLAMFVVSYFFWNDEATQPGPFANISTTSNALSPVPTSPVIPDDRGFALTLQERVELQEAEAEADAKADKAQEQKPWVKVKDTFVTRRASLDKVFTATLALHEVTKSHLLKVPSAKLSTAAVVGFAGVYAVVFNYVDVFVLIFMASLSLKMMTAEDRGRLWFQGGPHTRLDLHCCESP